MKPRSIFAAAFLLVLMLHAAVARPVQKVVDVEPPPLEKILANTTGKPHGVLAEVIAIKPEIPLGPLECAQGIRARYDLGRAENVCRCSEYLAGTGSQPNYARASRVSNPREI